MIFWQKISQSESSVLKTSAYLKRNQCNALRSKYGLCPYVSCTRFQCSSASSSRSLSIRRCLGTLTCSYLAADCCLVIDARPRRLRSADTRTLLVSRTRTNFGDRAFSAAGPRVWNYLPTDLRQPDLSESRHRRKLKTTWLSREPKRQPTDHAVL